MFRFARGFGAMRLRARRATGGADACVRSPRRRASRGSRACLINLQEPVLGGCWMYLQPEIVALSAIVEVVFSTPRCQGGLRDRLSSHGKPAFAGSGQEIR